MQLFLLLAITSFLISLTLTPVFRNLFRRLGVVDEPGGERKIHVSPVPRIGGIPLLVSMAVSFGLVQLFAPQGPQTAGLNLIFKLLAPASLVFLLGLADDLFGLRPWQKFAVQIAAAGWAYWLGVRVLGFAGFTAWEWVSLPLTVFWLVLCMNAFNLIDGVDGLAAGLGLFATLTMLAAGFMQANVPLAIATIPLAGSLMAFLRYNFNPATVFLGDSGSLLIGFLLGCYGVIWSLKTATLLGMVAPMMALFVPLLDVGLSVARRFLRHQPIFNADRGHIHHRLLERGLTPRGAVLTLYAICMAGALVSLVQLVLRNQFANVVVLLFCAAAWMGVQHLGYLEFNVARDMLLGGTFRRLIDAQVYLRRFQTDLEAARTLEQCWRVLQEGCRKFGFAGVRLCVDGEIYEQGPEGNGAGAYWALRVALSDRDYLNLLRGHGEQQHSPILGPLIDMLREKLQEKLPSLTWELRRKRTLKAGAASEN